MKPLISVIVPVYNTADFLPQCLDSVISQKFEDLEIILVDDGSTDHSVEICDAYADKDSRITVIHKDNKGVSHSRNVGIDMAKGEWLMFVDSDDELSIDCFRELSLGIRDNIDMIIGGYELIDIKGRTIYGIERKDIFTWDMKTCLRDVYRSVFYSYNGYCANRLFRRTIINRQQMHFQESIYSREDGLFLVQYLLRCSGLAYYTLASVYKYRKHSNNATSSFGKSFNPKIITGLDSHLSCIQLIKHESKDKLLLKYARKGLISSFRWNYLQLRKFDIKDINYYLQIVKKLFKGVNMFQYLLYQLEDKVPLYLHPITQIYRKSNLRCSYLDKYLSIKKTNCSVVGKR